MILKKMRHAALRWFWCNREKHRHKMNEVYRAMDISKQAFHQHLERYLDMLEEQEQLVPVIAEVRRDHPQMSARIMYQMIKPTLMGRDRFERFCFSRGVKIERKRAYHRTTDSRGVSRFDNLLIDLKLTGVNQVWVSDITTTRWADNSIT